MKFLPIKSNKKQIKTAKKNNNYLNISYEVFRRHFTS